MGLFGGSSKTYVGTNTSRLIEDNLLPDISRSAPLRAILRNEPITPNIVGEIIDSYALKIKRGINYAKSGEYIYKLPVHTFLDDNVGTNEVQAILENELNEPVQILYHSLSSLNYKHIAFKELHDNYNYNENTNEIVSLSNTVGFPVYLENMVSTVSASADSYKPDGTNIIWEQNPNARYTPYTNPESNVANWIFDPFLPNSVKIFYGWLDGTNTHQQSSFVINISSVYFLRDHFHTKYAYNLNAGSENIKIGYFTYRIFSGPYSTLDASLFSSNTNSDFLPVIFFRHDKLDISREENKLSNQYITSKKLCKKLGHDYDQLAEAINSNPDIADVEEAFLLYAVSISSTDSLAVKYLYEFFNWILLQDPASINNLDKAFTPEGIQYAHRTDRTVYLSVDDFHMQLNYGGIRSRIEDNIIGTVGTVVAVESLQSVADFTTVLGAYGSSVTISRNRRVVPLFIFVKQINLTQVHIIEAGELQLYYKIEGQNVRINTDEINGQLLIPLHNGIVLEHFSLLKRDRLYALSAHLVFNSRIVQDIPWYATSTFQIILAYIGIVVVVFSLGSATKAVTSAYASYAAAYGSIAAVALIALEIVFINYVLTEGLKYVAKELGGDVAIILGVLLFIYGGYSTINSQASWAPNLLKLSTGLIEAGNSKIAADISAYDLEAQEFKILEEEKLNELKELEKQFDNQLPFDPLELVGLIPQYYPGETSEEFYIRVFGNKDIVQISYDFIEQYHSSNLQLPSFLDSIREFQKNLENLNK